jgi:Sec-independent protein translocase protein TatA
MGKAIRNFKKATDTQEKEEIEATSKRPEGFLGRKE